MNQRNQGKLLAAAGILCFALAFVLLSAFKGEFGKDTAGSPSVVMEQEETLPVVPAYTAEDNAPRRMKAVKQNVQSDRIVVYVTGAVKRPGVYEVAQSSRVYEALNAAGGFSSDADQEAVNLAGKLEDGSHIKFPRIDESSKAESSAAPPSPSEKSLPAAVSAGKININSASLPELESIRGVGPKIAQAIIDYRNKNGNFSRIEDIMNVKGIGAKKFEAMKDIITVGN